MEVEAEVSAEVSGAAAKSSGAKPEEPDEAEVGRQGSSAAAIDEDDEMPRVPSVKMDIVGAPKTAKSSTGTVPPDLSAAQASASLFKSQRPIGGGWQPSVASGGGVAAVLSGSADALAPEDHALGLGGRQTSHKQQTRWATGAVSVVGQALAGDGAAVSGRVDGAIPAYEKEKYLEAKTVYRSGVEKLAGSPPVFDQGEYLLRDEQADEDMQDGSAMLEAESSTVDKTTDKSPGVVGSGAVGTVGLASEMQQSVDETEAWAKRGVHDTRATAPLLAWASTLNSPGATGGALGMLDAAIGTAEQVAFELLQRPLSLSKQMSGGTDAARERGGNGGGSVLNEAQAHSTAVGSASGQTSKASKASIPPA